MVTLLEFKALYIEQGPVLTTQIKFYEVLITLL